MTPMQRRFRKLLQRFGESFVSAGRTGTGVITTLSSGNASNYLTRTELDAAGRPIRIAYVPFDDTTAEFATLTWDGLILTVKRVVSVRFRGVTVAKMLVLV